MINEGVLYHFSEEPDIARFVPRVMPSRPGEEAKVWAMDADHSPLYFFPRDCPRIAFWPLPITTNADRERFLGTTSANRVIAVEGAWLERIRDVKVFRYVLPAAPFAPAETGDRFYGGYVAYEEVTPLAVEPLGDLLSRLHDAGAELRITPSLWPLYDALLPASLHFSMIRMRNAAPRHPAEVKNL